MIRAILSILIASAPLMLAATGALVSDCAGVLAIFMEGMVNLGAFLCFALTVKCGSAAAGVVLSVVLCMAAAFTAALMVEKSGANPFLVSLALCIISGALVPLLSQLMFGTRGVLADDAFALDAAATRVVTSVAAIGSAGGVASWLLCTRSGLNMRLCREDAQLLMARGVDVRCYVRGAWIAAAATAAAAGCTLVLRLSSFVPGVASGCGWLSLAAVYMGRAGKGAMPDTVASIGTTWTTCIRVYASVIGISAAEAAAVYALRGFGKLPHSLLLSLPYLAALILLVISDILVDALKRRK